MHSIVLADAKKTSWRAGLQKGPRVTLQTVQGFERCRADWTCLGIWGHFQIFPGLMVKLGETEMQVRFRLYRQSWGKASIMVNATSESVFLNVQCFFPASGKLQALVMRCLCASMPSAIPFLLFGVAQYWCPARFCHRALWVSWLYFSPKVSRKPSWSFQSANIIYPAYPNFTWALLESFQEAFFARPVGWPQGPNSLIQFVFMIHCCLAEVRWFNSFSRKLLAF